MAKLRLGEILRARGLVSDEREAFVVITAGRVFVNGQKAVSPSQLVGADDEIEVRSPREFVGRGAYKLEAAIEKFGVDARGKTCADVGAATGGFVEVLLKHGAKRVYAIDVGHGKLDLKLRKDPRVIVMEDTNVLTMPLLPERVNLVAIDVSFTSLRLVLPKIRSWRVEHGNVVALFKPQYELEDKQFLEHGILRDDRVRLELVERFRIWFAANGWQELGCMASPIRGSEGNMEYLFHLKPSA